MKIITSKETGTSKQKVFSLRLETAVIADVDKLAKSHKISRQKLINTILKTALSDGDFAIRLEKP